MARIQAFVPRGRWLPALALGLTLALALNGMAAAQTNVTDTGTHGDYHIFDSSGFPGGTCGYGADTGGYAYLHWIKDLGPTVKADLTDSVDHQQVSWQFKIQRQIGTGSWQTVASSSKQT